MTRTYVTFFLLPETHSWSLNGFRENGVVGLTLTIRVQYTKAMRLFKEDPKWTPLKRGEETDSNPYRKDYLQTTTSSA